MKPQPSMEQLLERSVHQARSKRLALAESDLSEWLAAIPEPENDMNNAAITVVEQKPAPLAKVSDDQGVSVDVVVARVEKVREVQRRIMKLGTHYGKVPGTEKDCLLKPGAEILGLTFQLDPEFANVERWEGEHLESVVTCTLYHAPTGNRLGSGIGSCSTREKKYAWRGGERKCPECGKAAIIKGKEEYGGGWVCFKKKDGCGAKFKADDKAITGQAIGRVPNPDLADNYNTVRKMACKRAHVAAILFVTCASEIFTQDVEDSDERGGPDLSPHQSPGQDWDAPPDDGGALGEEIARKLIKVKEALARCDSYDKALSLRAIIGTRAKMSELMKRHQAGKESGDISPRQASEIDKVWMHCDRQVAKKEKELATGPEDAMGGATAPEREPGEEG